MIDDPQSLDVAALLPHDPPMLLIETIERVSERDIEIVSTVREDNVFIRDGQNGQNGQNGQVRSAVLVEYMAQTVAAFAGLEARRLGGEVKAGYVVGLRLFEVFVDATAPGDRLRIFAERTFGDDARGNFDCRVERDGAVIARSTMTVYRGELKGENP